MKILQRHCTRSSQSRVKLRHIREVSPRAKFVAAFAAIYIIWGSTYLAIRIALETLPPFLMAGARFSIAGIALYLWAKPHYRERLERVHWRNAAIIGGLLLVAGNGGVVLAERVVPSGLAALLVALLPIFMALLEWGLPKGKPPSRGVVMGLVLGVIGLVVLIGPTALHRDPASSAGGIRLVGVALLMFASFGWASGSLYSQRAKLPSSASLSTAMEMMCAGAMLLVIAALAGEPAQFHFSTISTRSILAVMYLITFGSIIAFSSYVWLLTVAKTSQIATYAYVNPVVAIILGWAFAGESLSLRTGVASAVIIAAVVIITTSRSK